MRDTREFKPFITKDRVVRVKVVVGERLREMGRGGRDSSWSWSCGRVRWSGGAFWSLATGGLLAAGLWPQFGLLAAGLWF